MDTDYLSIPTYKGIITEAEKFNYDLTLQFSWIESNKSRKEAPVKEIK